MNFRAALLVFAALFHGTRNRGGERLAEDPTFRMLASRERRETSVALTSTPPKLGTADQRHPQ